MQWLRAIVLAAGLLFSYATVAHFRSGYDSEMVPPPVPLAMIALQLGDWTGTDVEMREDTVRVIGAHSFINRIYRDAAQREVSLHVAAFTDPQFRGCAPHHPEVCYPAAGWKIVKRERAVIDAVGVEIPIEYMLMQARSESLVTAHWYQSGEFRFVGAGGLSSEFTKLWGQPRSPCTEKYLLQMQQPSIDSAKPFLEPLVRLLHEARRGMPEEDQLASLSATTSFTKSAELSR